MESSKTLNTNILYSELETAGRLGNQLWEIASTIGIANDVNGHPVFPANWSYRPYFNVPDEFFEPLHTQSINATDFVSHMDIRCKAYLQDYSLFKRVEDQIREWFTPSDEAKTILSKHLSDTHQQWITEDSYVSLHVRRGDNVTHPPGFHPLVTLKYYQQAAAKFASDKIVVFSDDIPWCEQTLPEALQRDDLLFMRDGPARGRDYIPEEYLADPALDWIDLQLMALCHHHIIANSTYSWWGAFLGDNGRVVYPSVWFGKKLSYIDWTLMIPKEWEMVKC